jgi:hypothetical protein
MVSLFHARDGEYDGINQYRKVLWFAGFGAAGCAAAALLAEVWLVVTRTVPQPAPVAVCFILDCSSSMAGDKLNEMQRAASDFVQQQTLARDQLAVVGFDSTAQLACPLSDQKPQLLSAISGLRPKREHQHGPRTTGRGFGTFPSPRR